MASAAGQTQGSGRYGGCGRFHPGGNSGGGGWGFSESMRFFHERGLGGGRDNGFLARFTIPADQQSEDAKEIYQTRGHPHQQAAQLLVFGGRQSPLILYERENAEPVHGMKINRADFHGRERDDDS